MKGLRSYGILFQLGWVVALSVLIPLGLGLWLDHRFSTSPLFILVGALLGILASTFGVVRVATRAMGRFGDSGQAETDEPNRKEDENA